MELLLQNYKLIIGMVMVIIAVGIGAYRFFTLSSKEQKYKIRTVVLALVIEAEKMYGSKTGKVKLAHVYSLLIARFPYLKYVPLSFIEKLIDESLEEMRELLETKPEILKNKEVSK